MMTTRHFFLISALILCATAAACSVMAAPTKAPTDQPDAATAEQTVPGIEETRTSDVEPSEVSFFTPSQQEGPYYPVDKPVDHDNDLVDFAGATAAPDGEVLSLNGIVYDASGMPVGAKQTSMVEEPIGKCSGLLYGGMVNQKAMPIGIYVEAVREVNEDIADGISELIRAQ